MLILLRTKPVYKYPLLNIVSFQTCLHMNYVRTDEEKFNLKILEKLRTESPSSKRV